MHTYLRHYHQNLCLVCALLIGLLMIYAAVLPGQAQTPNDTTSFASQQATLTLRLRLKPKEDTGRFHLQINDETVAAAVGHGGASAAKPVRPGSHIVSIIADEQTRMSDYQTTIVCMRNKKAPGNNDDDNGGGDGDDDDDGGGDDLYHLNDRGNSRVVARATNTTSLALELSDNDVVTCTITQQRRPAIDLWVNVSTEPRVAIPGGPLLYTINYGNHSQHAMNEVALQVTVPANSVFTPATSSAGWQCTPNEQPESLCHLPVGELAPGSEGVALFGVLVASPLPAGVNQIQNDVAIHAVRHEVGQRQLFESGVHNATPVAAAPELAITNSDNGVLAQVGGVIIYTLTYVNSGNQGATGVVINETVPKRTKFNASLSTPGWNCRANPCVYAVGALAAGGSGTLQFAVTLADLLPADLPEIENVATIRDDGANGEERDLANNIARESTPFAGRPVLTATMQAQLAVDADNNGFASPGDTLEYQVIISNPSASDATGVLFTNRLANDTRLVASSFRGAPGLMLKQDPQDEQMLIVTVDKLGGSQPVTFSFRTLINKPASVIEIVNQGKVTASQLAAILTDDPTVPGAQDPTITPLDARPTVRVQMIDYLLLDHNNNDLVNAGDTLIYGLTIVNVGNRPAADVILELQPESNTPLVAGSVYANKGAVVAGNQLGNTQMHIAIGRLAVGERVTINFEVQVSGTVLTPQVANQAVVNLRDSATGAPFRVLSDDPDTPRIGDPTVTPVTGLPQRLYLSVVSRR